MSKGTSFDPKKGKVVGSAADGTIEYLIDILTHIFVQTFSTGRWTLCYGGLIWDG